MPKPLYVGELHLRKGVYALSHRLARWSHRVGQRYGEVSYAAALEVLFVKKEESVLVRAPA